MDRDNTEILCTSDSTTGTLHPQRMGMTPKPHHHKQIKPELTKLKTICIYTIKMIL